MPNRTHDDPWERQKGESQKAYEAFVIYRDLGAERSTAKVSQELGKSKALIQRWCRAWNWVERCRAYDNSLDEAARRKALKKYQDMTARHIRIALQMQEKALADMSELPDGALSPKDILQFLDKAIAVEKAARMEEAGITGGKRPDSGQQDGGAPSLADEIIGAYEARKRGEKP